MASKILLTSALSALALAAPFENLDKRASCASVYGQCGGKNWNGPTCCTSGNHCQANGEYYSQCLPGAGSGGGDSTPTTTSVKQQPTTTKGNSPGNQATSTASPGGAEWSGNPFEGVEMWANSYYADEIKEKAIPNLSSGLSADAAAKVAEVPSFLWLDTADKVEGFMAPTLADIRKANEAGGNYAGLFVVYDLPDRDCAAAASNGEYDIDNNGLEHYYAYIDSIVKLVKEYSDVRHLLVIEPDSLANLVTNMNVAKCSGAHDAYLKGVNYAVKNLNLPNVAMYLDAGHAGWLGWPANLPPAAQLFANVYKDAGSPKALRGLATNVANYNGWSLSFKPGYTDSNQNYDERRYVTALEPALAQNGWSGAHFITDLGRSGKQPTGQNEWGDWCNVEGTGFGKRPTSNTGLEIEDAFVWVKPGGESDGTSNTSAERYDFHCGLSDALQPAPEAGTWFQAYFEQLLKNAEPSFA